MRLKIFIFSVVMLNIGNLVMGQTITSLPKDSVVWRMLNRSPKSPGDYYRLYDRTTGFTLMGDTLIDSTTYKVLYRSKFYKETQPFAFDYIYAFFRYTGSRVYMRYANYNTYRDTSEFLLYDFGLKQGDHFAYRYSDTIEISGKTIHILREDTADVYEVKDFLGTQGLNFYYSPDIGGGKIIKMKCRNIGYLNNNRLRWPSNWYQIGMEDSMEYLFFITGIGTPNGLLYPEITADNIMDTLSTNTCMYYLVSGNDHNPVIYRSDSIHMDMEIWNWEPHINGKTLCANPVNKSFQTGIPNSHVEKLVIFENPVRSSTITLHIPLNRRFILAKIIVVDQYGRVMFSTTNEDQDVFDISVDCRSWSNGIYYIQVFDQVDKLIQVSPLLYLPD